MALYNRFCKNTRVYENKMKKCMQLDEEFWMYPYPRCRGQGWHQKAGLTAESKRV